MIDNPEAYREYCLALGEVSEKMPFGKFAPRYETILALYTLGHIFTYADVSDFTVIYVKVNPDTIDELYAGYDSIGPPMNMSRRHWVSIQIGGDMPDAKVQELLAEAYQIVRKQYTKKRGVGVLKKSLRALSESYLMLRSKC